MASPSVLVVDPDPSIRALLVALIRRRGIAVECAESREAALARTAGQSYTAFIVEPRMPEGDALLHELHAANGDGHPPNIIVATTPDAHSAALAMRPGVKVVLLKPFQLEELYESVDSCCR